MTTFEAANIVCKHCGKPRAAHRDYDASCPTSQAQAQRLPKIDIRPCALCHTNETGFVCTRRCEEQADAQAQAQQGLTTERDFTLTEEQAAFLRDSIGADDPASIRLQIGDGHAGFGLYVSHTDYPEEGSSLVCPLRASTAAAPSPVPAGWQLVPREPTPEMIEAASLSVNDNPERGWESRAYRAMLFAAAPRMSADGGKDIPFTAAPGAPTPAPKGTT
jgi:hypothetical protein